MSSSEENQGFEDTVPGGPVTIPSTAASEPGVADGAATGDPSELMPLWEETGRQTDGPVPTRTAAGSRLALSFTGEGTEYFKIWAVNLMLTIVTLGVYSAWAKVRRLRYFYANTTLTGSTFDFHGAPVAILRGRIIALLVLVGYTQAPKISLLLYGVVALFILMIFPWLYWRSLRFRFGNTSFRGARFNFTGDLRTAYEILLPPVTLFLAVNIVLIISAPSMAVRGGDGAMLIRVMVMYALAVSIWPYYYHRLRAYQHGHAVFGATSFQYEGSAGQFYVLAGKILIVVIAAVLLMGLDVALITFSATRFVVIAVLFGVLAFVLYVAMFALIPYASARAQNIVWNNTSLGGAGFTSTLSFTNLLKVEVVNLLATMLTLGLFRPFAAIRTAKARIEAVSYQGDPASFEAGSFAVGGAAGSEIGEMIGFDIAL